MVYWAFLVCCLLRPYVIDIMGDTSEENISLIPFPSRGGPLLFATGRMFVFNPGILATPQKTKASVPGQ